MSETKKVKYKNTPLYTAARVAANILFRVIFPTKYEGTENIPKNHGFLLCSNHRSLLDPLIIGVPIPQQMRFMAKDSLFRNRFFSWLITRLGAFPIKRGSADTKAVDTSMEILQEGGVLVVFPEGTRSKTDELLPHKAGAALIASRSGGDVLPCAVSWKGKLRPFRRIVVRYGDLIPNEEIRIQGVSKTEIKAVMLRIQNAVASLYGYPEPRGNQLES